MEVAQKAVPTTGNLIENVPVHLVTVRKANTIRRTVGLWYESLPKFTELQGTEVKIIKEVKEL